MPDSALEPRGIIRVQTWDSSAADSTRVRLALGIDWPTATGTVANGQVDVLCIGPTDWLLIAAAPQLDEVLRRLAAGLEGSTFRPTNVSHALSRIGIDGTEARVLLGKGCALDLHPRRFPPGRCARTRFAGMPAILRCTQPSTFECIVTASYLQYLASWLRDAALEFGQGVQVNISEPTS